MCSYPTKGRNRAARSTGGHGFLRVWMVVVAGVAAGTAVPVVLHTSRYGLTTGQLLLALFLWINVLVTFLEISLFLQINLIKERYAEYVLTYRGREFDRLIEFVTAPIRWSEVPRPRRWADGWATYALFDDAYASEKAFGFWGDTGNGFSTLIPSALFLYGMTYDVLPARWLGTLGVALFWQKLYGTVIYFWAYLYNRQFAGHAKRDVVFVVLLNVLWLLGPAWGLVVSIGMIRSGGFAFVR
ncbi:hypothetical protein BMW24_008600 [Mycobacterium heckeshornense]|uniref:Uncharacterized protein n=1 Tax=Mycobacterium heckeshornense TaxID=110505 RepID=A0A2G8BDT5_9MYCO|nr:hypothetical protein [Mycobacterium heckeshornense]KMV20953.1 hypothetical protein ACT16_19270 [Mycobacterium heckeshornense]MCV7036220.1 hypothetical protein [Mycobacterium heckeshornense]PIJ35816.1 hypothetical protein BMW24_008600 [Mycobacterium heckeshornense]BCO35994.1 hypothetical protein MHEC_24270 [Mycobacterium heckeshornense]